MDNQNILRIVLSFAIIATLFLPLYNETVTGATMSTWQILTGGVSATGDAAALPVPQTVLVICLAVVLITTVVILVFSILRKPTSVLLNLLPLIATIILVIVSMTQSQDNVGQALQAFGTGFYIMFLSSFLLPFTSIAVPNPSNQ
jgi:drug/metabolite transporter superfamily protein YnfA